MKMLIKFRSLCWQLLLDGSTTLSRSDDCRCQAVLLLIPENPKLKTDSFVLASSFCLSLTLMECLSPSAAGGFGASIQWLTAAAGDKQSPSRAEIPWVADTTYPDWHEFHSVNCLLSLPCSPFFQEM